MPDEKPETQDGMIPQKDLDALRQSLQAQINEREKAIADLKSELASARQTPQKDGDVELAATRQNLQKEMLEFSESKKVHQQEVLLFRRQQFAAQYGVPLDDVKGESPAEAELTALRIVAARNQNGSGGGKPVPLASRMDTPGGSAGAVSDSQLTSQEMRERGGKDYAERAQAALGRAGGKK